MVVEFRHTLENLAKSGMENAKIAAAVTQAQNLEGQLKGLYKLVVDSLQRQDNIDKVAEVWEVMEQISDAFNREIADQHGSDHPSLKAIIDNVLDIRNSCTELKEMHRYKTDKM
jgi:hypothetical protein